MGRPGDKKDDRRGAASEKEALREAFADVKPLRAKSSRRVRRPADAVPARSVAKRAAPGDQPLSVERESNGIVLGKRPGVHPSIVDALEDPKLEVQAQCDLHGHTKSEAEREVHRFLRQSQEAGMRWVLIIVGKGLHSPDGKGTLQSHVIDALSKRAPARFVLAFGTAPRRLGGTGALVVRLQSR